MSNTNPLLAAAGFGLTPITFDTDYAPPRADIPNYAEQIDQREEIEHIISTTTVREETHQKLTAELLDAERKGWNIANQD